jgi:hypothetical protein
MSIKTQFTKKEHIDSGLAFLLISLIAGYGLELNLVLSISIVGLLVVMILPSLFYPFTFLWLNFSLLLGRLMSKLILGIIFFIVVFPVAVFRKLLRKDSLLLKKFKSNSDSVFFVRDHRYSKEDFNLPY